MVPYFLDFSKTLSEYQEQPYPTEKITIVFLDPPKKNCVTFVGYSWNSQRIFLYSTFPGQYFQIFPGISLEIFCDWNILEISQGNVP